MMRLRMFLYRLCRLFRKGSMEHDLDKELHFHLQKEIDENLRKGARVLLPRTASVY
jgi:hypothetical protein